MVLLTGFFGAGAEIRSARSGNCREKKVKIAIDSVSASGTLKQMIHLILTTITDFFSSIFLRTVTFTTFTFTFTIINAANWHKRGLKRFPLISRVGNDDNWQHFL